MPCNAQNAPTALQVAKSEKNSRAILQDTCESINRLYRAEGFSMLVPSINRCNFTFHAASSNCPATWECHDDTVGSNEGPSAGMLAETGQVTGFTHMAVQRAMQSTGSPKLPSMEWTEKRKIEDATKFAQIFIGTLGKLLSKPVVNGWCVRWSELSSSGIPFWDSAVTVYISPNYGPYSIGTNFNRYQYIDKHHKLITREEASSRSKEALAKNLKL